MILNLLILVFDKKTPDVSLPLSQTITHTGNPFIINPYDITCNLPDPMTTPVCIANTLVDFKEDKKSKRVKSPNLKC